MSRCFLTTKDTKHTKLIFSCVSCFSWLKALILCRAKKCWLETLSGQQQVNEQLRAAHYWSCAQPDLKTEHRAHTPVFLRVSFVLHVLPQIKQTTFIIPVLIIRSTTYMIYLKLSLYASTFLQ